MYEIILLRERSLKPTLETLDHGALTSYDRHPTTTMDVKFATSMAVQLPPYCMMVSAANIKEYLYRHRRTFSPPNRTERSSCRHIFLVEL
ncbi:hypothetical protein BDR06DRAFT_948974 [Suillus hirtellus]|nr:hypothetical protein BDR06DRAFT_948974 [Suillus hirtellus]